MPALSWPRCCRANKPKWVSLAASGFPYIANTPHSSWNLSNIVLQRLFPAVFEFADIPLDQRLTLNPLAYAWVSNDDTILHCRSDLYCFDSVPGGDLNDALWFGSGYQHSGGAFVEQQALRPQIGIEIDIGADARWSEG